MYKKLLSYIVLVSHALAVPTLSARQSDVPYGTVIYSCTRPGVVALTFDDGPFIYTQELLNTLRASGQRATFFVNGQNWGNINNHVSTIRRMVAEGHQVASHTWSHPDLATLDAAGVTSQMRQLEAALSSILGYFPQYMRPPYFSYNDATLRTLGSLGYHVIQCDIDTLDWRYNTPATIGTSYSIYENGLNGGGRISLMHDVHRTTVQTLVPRVLSLLAQRGLRCE
ncbi:hypothetical protein DL764_002829 [Monosporascus ibericus]|uniref:NodB homology domain-containing protein n=1 Tax=Monosporascus ibericus TaxID=155417 RepID=A0A4Q4TJ12_9PEZI|nr:hypothetical protein DL764_002829 [Monosporascus ibericus]